MTKDRFFYMNPVCGLVFLKYSQNPFVKLCKLKEMHKKNGTKNCC